MSTKKISPLRTQKLFMPTHKNNLDFYKGRYFEVVAQLENLKFDHWGMEVARRSLQLRSSFECFYSTKEL